MARCGNARLMAVVALVLAAVMSGGCGGSNSSTATSPSPTPSPTPTPTPTPTSTCRTYPTNATIHTVTSASSIAFDSLLTGAFDSSTKKTTVSTMFANGAPCNVLVTSYNSVADFVDEVRVIPPVFMSTTSVSTNSGACGSGTATNTFTYDSQRRLTQLSNSAGGVTTYTAWDGSGRPTTGNTGGNPISIVYDDAARAWTSTQTGSSPSVGTLTFDANGNQVKNVVVQGGVTTTTTFTNTATATVCK